MTKERRVKIGKGGELAMGLGHYTAVYERDEDNRWIVEIAELPQCHVDADSLSRARRKIRAALGVWVDDADTATIMDDVRLPTRAANAISAYRHARETAERAQAEASGRSRELVRRLRELGLSTRDAADVAGLSQRRVAQLATEG